MRLVKALYDGYHIRLIEPVAIKKNRKVFVIIPDDDDKIPSAEARKLLKGSGKGENLCEKLLKSRKEDLNFEQR